MRVNRAWLGLVVLMLPTLLVALDMTALLLALPRLSADLGASGVEQLWISDSYGLVVAGLVITMGTLGDRIGRRRLLMTGGAAFGVLSVVAAFAVSPLMLIVARALLGVAGATLAPSTLALITNMFRDERQRGKAVAIWATCQFTGGALGPVLAGFLLQYFWWGSVFLLAVPAMAVLLLAGPTLLPEFRGERSGRLDPVSVGLSLVAVLLMIYGFKQLAVGSAAAVPGAALVVGALVGSLFVRRQLRLETPLLDLRLLRGRPFTAVLVALVLAGVAMAGTGLLVTQYLQSVLGFSPATSALLFAPMGLGVAVGTMAAPALARHVRRTTAIMRRPGGVGARRSAADRGRRRVGPAAGDDRHHRAGAGHRPAVRPGHRAGHRVRTAAARGVGGVDVGDRQLLRRLARPRAAGCGGHRGLPRPDARDLGLAGRCGGRRPAPARGAGRGAAARGTGGVHREPARHGPRLRGPLHAARRYSSWPCAPSGGPPWPPPEHVRPANPSFFGVALPAGAGLIREDDRLWRINGVLLAATTSRKRYRA